ncbi:MAG: CHAD domain-containing protein [Halothiobacillaceae bacterium]|nr:CHAD domain-containing protein [Halothiobacillaceae bacterium]
MLKLDELARSTSEGCVHVVRQRLHEFVLCGQVLLDAPQADEALHDARVAIRRARVWLKLAEEAIAVAHKDVRALRAFARESSPVRDMEVQLAWLAALQLDEDEQPGQCALLEVLRADFQQRRALLLETLPGALAGAKHALKALHPLAEHDEPLGAWLAEHWMDVAAFYIEDVPHLPENLHAVRLVGKQLRYLLEPVMEALGAEDVMQVLRRGQDALGRVNDVRVLRAALPRYVGLLVGQQVEADVHLSLDMELAPTWAMPSVWVGLRTVCARVLEEETEALAELHGWRLAHADTLVAGLQRIGVQLAGSGFDGFGNPT